MTSKVSMVASRLIPSCLVPAVAFAVLAAEGCSAEPAPPAKVIPAPGQVMLALSTDLVPGKDFNDLRVVVSYEGRTNDSTSLTWSVIDGVVRGSVTLPATLAVVGRDDAGRPATIRATALLDGIPRVHREATIQIPKAGVKLLRLEVSGLCYDHVRRTRREDVRSDCDPGATCVLGTCESSLVDAAALPDYSPELVFGTSKPAARDARCLDVLGSFGGGFDAIPRLEGGRCVLGAADLVAPSNSSDAGISDAGGGDAGVSDAAVSDAQTLPPDASPPAADAAPAADVSFSGNLALRLPPLSAGFCTPDHCLLPITAHSPSGWRADGPRILLPRAVCDSPSPRVAVSPGSEPMRPGTYACGEWHGAAAAPRSKAIAPPIRTLGEPCRDTTALCTEHNTTCGDLWVHDASCGRDRVVQCGRCAGDVEGMVLIPGGTFTMGAPANDPNGSDDERPETRLALPWFWLDRTEVTAEAYAECLNAGICTRAGTGGICNMHANDRAVPGRERHPINCETWYQASAYCAWRGRRLPTEQEWEYAARGGPGGTRTFPWGEAVPTQARVCMSGPSEADINSTCEVGSRPLGASVHGVQDLAGNMWEWTASVYSAAGHGQLGDPDQRTEKGGCWASHGSDTDPGFRHHLRAAFRSYDVRGYTSRTVGFRCARDF